MKAFLHLAAGAGSLVIAGCSLEAPRVCTEEFRYVTVQVTDAAGQPVRDAAVDVVRSSTGRSIVCAGGQSSGCVDPYALAGPSAGTYVVFDDAQAAARQGETFRVVASRGASRAEAPFVFFSDGCHVDKRSGPDVLRLAP